MKKIMIIDDCPHALNLAGCYLERNGYQPVQVDDPMDAALAILNEMPDLVVLGFEQMCYADLDLITMVRNWEQTQNVPWVLCTPRVAEAMRLVDGAVPIDGYLPKPLREPALIAQLRQIFNGPVRQTKPGTVYLAPTKGFGEKTTGFWPKERRTRHLPTANIH